MPIIVANRNGIPRARFSWSHPAIALDDAVWLQQTLEREIECGRAFRDGQTLQIGWTILRVREIQPNEVILEEPDFKSFPIQWVPSVDRCLRDLRQQKDVVESIQPAMEPVFPSIDQAARVCVGFGSTPAVIVERADPDSAFSGWYMTCEGDDHSHDEPDLKYESLYALSLKCPFIVPFLALPPGHAGRISSSGFELESLKGPVILRPSSYLDLLSRRAIPE